MDHTTLQALRALTDATRLRIVGRLATAPASAATLGGELDLSPGVVRRQLGLLISAGLVAEVSAANDTGTEPRYRVRSETLDGLGRALAATEQGDGVAAGPGIGPAGESMPPEDARVLRGFFAEDRLVSIPAHGSKRLVVLRYLRDRCFVEDRPYPEKEVNQRLALFHPDVAALRRYMVDAGLMTRDAGVYRRAP
jgi:DNA-binding transcriptional ArsR family regulator